MVLLWCWLKTILCMGRDMCVCAQLSGSVPEHFDSQLLCRQHAHTARRFGVRQRQRRLKQRQEPTTGDRRRSRRWRRRRCTSDDDDDDSVVDLWPGHAQRHSALASSVAVAMAPAVPAAVARRDAGQCTPAQTWSVSERTSERAGGRLH